MADEIRNDEQQIVEENTPEVKETEREVKESTKEEVKTYTQDEVNKIVQQRLAKEKAKFEKDTEEAKKLAQMNAKEKADYEFNKKQEELAKREAELTKRELTAEAKNMLQDEHLPTELHTLINYESAETVKESVGVIKLAIQKATEEAVKERLKGNAPKVNAEVQSIAKGFAKVNEKYAK